jgi:hypothetical protein
MHGGLRFANPPYAVGHRSAASGQRSLAIGHRPSTIGHRPSAIEIGANVGVATGLITDHI